MIRSQRNYMDIKYKRLSFLIHIFIITACLTGCSGSSAPDVPAVETVEAQETTENTIIEKQSKTVLPESKTESEKDTSAVSWTAFDIEKIPAYSGNPYVTVNNNMPYFGAGDLEAAAESFEQYAELDALGRCGAAYASIGMDIMPMEERGPIGQIRPSGWHLVKYDVVDGKYLFNRCHLIGYQLAGENANEKNLITGTRYLNVDGMLPFEDLVADYVKETGNHVLYRVTPIFNGNNLVASGVLMEAESVEDLGGSILFCVYVYNAQPGIIIDYATGDSRAADTENTEIPTEQTPISAEYILNTNTRKFHYPSCPSVKQMADKNKQPYSGSREDIIGMRYEACKNCRP